MNHQISSKGDYPSVSIFGKRLSLPREICLSIQLMLTPGSTESEIEDAWKNYPNENLDYAPEETPRSWLDIF